LNDQNLWGNILNNECLELNLDKIDFIAHDGLIWVIFILLFRKEKGFKTFIYLPNDEKKVGFLKYVGFHNQKWILNFEYLNEYAMLSSYKYPVRNELLKPLHKLYYIDGENWWRKAQETTSAVKDYIIHTYGLVDIEWEVYELINPFVITLQELMQNIASHGGSLDGKGTGYISFIPPPRKYTKITYCFTDIGKGFKDTLFRQHNMNCDSHEESIIEALLFRYSRPEEGIRGIYKTLPLIRNREGSIRIRSGTVLFTLDFSKEKNRQGFDNNYKEPTEKIIYEDEKNWLRSISHFSRSVDINIPGTHILIDLKAPSRQER